MPGGLGHVPSVRRRPREIQPAKPGKACKLHVLASWSRLCYLGRVQLKVAVWTHQGSIYWGGGGGGGEDSPPNTPASPPKFLTM